MKIKNYALLFVVISFTMLDSQESLVYKYSQGDTVKVPAPVGVSDKILGNSFDSKFRNQNKKLFEKGEPVHTNEEQYLAELTVLDNSVSLEANINFLNLAKGGISFNSDKRYAVLSVYHVTKTITFNPDGEKKGNGDYFLKRIYYGWSINYVISGTSSSFSAEAKTKLDSIVSGLTKLNFENTLKEYKLESQLKLTGLKPKKDSPSIILDPYKVADYFDYSEKEIPIFLEYEVVKDFESEKVQFNSSLVKPGKYKIAYIRLEISNLKPNSKLPWDALGGWPDPVVDLYINGIKTLSSDIVHDTLTPTFTINRNIIINEGDLLQITVTDIDYEEHDLIGDAWIQYDDLSQKSLSGDIDFVIRDNSGLKNAVMKLIPIK